MAIDWSKVASDAEAAVTAIIGKDWSTVRSGAKAQLAALVQLGKSLEESAKAGTISDIEYKSLQLSQKNAMTGVLHSYAAIGIVMAEQAAAAAWDVVAQALKTAYNLAFIP